MSAGTVQGLLARFPKARLLVVGDLILDEFVWGQVSRISPEAPVPIVWVQRESVMPGGASNVANNVRALGGQVAVVGAVGQDGWGDALLDELAVRGIDTSGVIRDARPTTVKTRVIAHHQQVVRVDREQPDPLQATAGRRLRQAVLDRLPSVDAVIIEDYGKGVITAELLSAIIPAARRLKKLITVDPKEEHVELYRGVTSLTPNRQEAGRMVGRDLKRDEDLSWAGSEILRRLQCDAVLITLGEGGMWLFEQGGRQTRIPTVAQEVFDVAGAGDTVIATYTLALASGAPMAHAARLANHAAGIVVGKLGVAVTTPQELQAAIDGKPRSSARRASRHAGSSRRG